LAQGLDISANLQRLAERRTDIFGDKEVDIGSRIGEDKEEAKRKEKERTTWDGHTASIQHIAMEVGGAVRQQIKAIHESKGLTGETVEPAIGPKVPGMGAVRPPPPPQIRQPQAPPLAPPRVTFGQPQMFSSPVNPMMYHGGVRGIMVPQPPFPVASVPPVPGVRMPVGSTPAKIVGDRPAADGEPPTKKKERNCY